MEITIPMVLGAALAIALVLFIYLLTLTFPRVARWSFVKSVTTASPRQLHEISHRRFDRPAVDALRRALTRSTPEDLVLAIEIAEQHADRPVEPAIFWDGHITSTVSMIGTPVSAGKEDAVYNEITPILERAHFGKPRDAEVAALVVSAIESRNRDDCDRIRSQVLQLLKYAHIAAGASVRRRIACRDGTSESTPLQLLTHSQHPAVAAAIADVWMNIRNKNRHASIDEDVDTSVATSVATDILTYISEMSPGRAKLASRLVEMELLGEYGLGGTVPSLGASSSKVLQIVWRAVSNNGDAKNAIAESLADCWEDGVEGFELVCAPGRCARYISATWGFLPDVI